jgi:hypothetical protein
MRSLACLLGLLLIAGAGRARADADDTAALDKVTKLNKRAVDEYENLNFEEARKILKDALDACVQAGLDKHPVAARTHVHLGVVLLAGFKQKDQAVKEFRKALDIQPEIKLDKTLANPEIQAVYDEAVQAQKGQPAAGAGAAPEAPTEAGGSAPPPVADAVVHEPVLRSEQGKPIPINVTIDASLGAKNVVLSFSADGSDDFGERKMQEASPGNWTGEIPASATEGAKVSYYIEVNGADDQLIGSKGSATAPLVVKLLGPGGAPLVPAKKVQAPPPKEPENTGPSWFLSVGFGSGFGWTTGNGEVNGMDKIKPAGFAPAKLVHIAPEIGYFIQPHLLLSLQGRFQIITGPTPYYSTTECTGGECAPASYAIAGFGRARWLFGEDSLHPFVGGLAGLGTIRHVTSFPATADCGLNGKTTCVDTIKSGPVFVGGTAGFMLDVTSLFSFVAETNIVAGFTSFTFNFDLNLGVAVQF